MKRFCAERETTQYLRKPQLSKREEQQPHDSMQWSWENIAIFKQDTDHVMPQHKQGKLAPKPFLGCTVQLVLEIDFSKMGNFISDDQTHFWYWLSWREHQTYPQGTEEQENN